MGNHFHLLVRVPERPAGFDVPLERVMMMARAVGPERIKVLRSQFRVWERGGGDRRMAAADAGAHVLPAQAGCAEWRC